MKILFALSGKEDGGKLSTIVDVVKKIGKFDTILVVLTDSTLIRTSILGFEIEASPAILVSAGLYDVASGKYIATVYYPERIFESSKILNITTAGKNSISTLLEGK